MSPKMFQQIFQAFSVMNGETYGKLMFTWRALAEQKQEPSRAPKARAKFLDVFDIFDVDNSKNTP